MTEILTADAILASDDLAVREVEVPEWGGTVLVAALTGKARDAYESSLTMQRGHEVVGDTRNLRAKLVGRALVGADRKTRLFTDQQINALGEKSGAVLDRLYDVVAELSGMGPKAVEDAQGNSDAVPSDGSISA